MSWSRIFHILLLVLTPCIVQAFDPTICAEEACRCDAFTRVICNCTQNYGEVTLRPDGAYRVPPFATAIVIEGCARVQFLTNTIRGLIQLRLVELRNIDSIIINEYGLNWSPHRTNTEQMPGIRIIIDNSTVTDISSNAIQGRVDDILISNSKLINTRNFAFSSLTGVKNIELIDNMYENIARDAFKTFSTTNFILRGGVVKYLPSRFLARVSVTELFLIENSNIGSIESSAFIVNSPQRVLIESNHIETLNGDGFHIVTRGAITFRNNTISTLGDGAFLGFSVDPEIIGIKGLQGLLIDNNTITNVVPNSLSYNRTSVTLRIDGLNLNMTCSCDIAKQWQNILKDYGGLINCWYSLEDYYISIPTYMDRRCGAIKQTFWIFVVVGILIGIIAAIIIAFFLIKREKEKKKKVKIVMPDGKTYRETEFHIVVERAELLTTNL